MAGNEQGQPFAGHGDAATVSRGAVEVEKSHPYIKGFPETPVPKDRRRTIPVNVSDEGVRSRSELDLPPPVLTVQDFAVLLATSSSGVYSRVARGQIPGAFRIGRSLRFDRRVIAQWLSANKASAGGLS